MKFLTFYSDSHISLYEIFLESFNKFLSEKYTLLTKKIEQRSQNGDYHSPGFDLTMVDKLDWIIENIDLEDTNPLIFSDCDIQFFGDLKFDLRDNDILFSHDFYENFNYSWYPDGKTGYSPYPNYCAGFFICKQNAKVLNFFKDVRSNLLNNLDGFLHDQIVINKLIGEGYDISHNKLNSDHYWTVGFSTNGKVWNGQNFNVPKSVIVHHANFTIGIENKLRLIKLVKEKLY
jgi:hypothetical protein